MWGSRKRVCLLLIIKKRESGHFCHSEEVSVQSVWRAFLVAAALIKISIQRHNTRGVHPRTERTISALLPLSLVLYHQTDKLDSVQQSLTKLNSSVCVSVSLSPTCVNLVAAAAAAAADLVATTASQHTTLLRDNHLVLMRWAEKQLPQRLHDLPEHACCWQCVAALPAIIN